MKERELVELGNCRICGKPPICQGKLPIFYKITISRHGIDAYAVRRRAGLGMMLTEPLARAMGTDEDLAVELVAPATGFVHEECADKVHHLLLLMPEENE